MKTVVLMPEKTIADTLQDYLRLQEKFRQQEGQLAAAAGEHQEAVRGLQQRILQLQQALEEARETLHRRGQ